MLKFALKTIIIFSSLVAFLSVAMAETSQFSKPRLQGNRLDWCYNWAANCGKPVADAYCKRRGFSYSTKFKKANNVGVPTRLIGNPAQVCSGQICDSFKYIRCWRPSPTRLFVKPKLQGTRLDWCYNWATNCGKPAADAYCQRKGYNRSVGFKKANNVGVPTRLIGNPAQVCSGAICDSFKFVRCTN